MLVTKIEPQENKFTVLQDFFAVVIIESKHKPLNFGWQSEIDRMKQDNKK